MFAIQIQADFELTSDHGRRRASNLGGLYTFCLNFLLFFQKICPSETYFCLTWGAAALLLSSPTLMRLITTCIVINVSRPF